LLGCFCSFLCFCFCSFFFFYFCSCFCFCSCFALDPQRLNARRASRKDRAKAAPLERSTFGRHALSFEKRRRLSNGRRAAGAGGFGDFCQHKSGA
jgi:hypothetical protein